jgi:hypothetical protein
VSSRRQTAASTASNRSGARGTGPLGARPACPDRTQSLLADSAPAVLNRSHAARNASSNPAACTSLPGMRWPYRSSVMEMFAWPMYVDRAFALTPAAIAKLA